VGGQCRSRGLTGNGLHFQGAAGRGGGMGEGTGELRGQRAAWLVDQIG
jgi:hypothetical protein